MCITTSDVVRVVAICMLITQVVCCAVTLGDTPNFFGPQPMEQQVGEEATELHKLYNHAGKMAASIQPKHAGRYRQEWTLMKDSVDVDGQQRMMQQ